MLAQAVSEEELPQSDPNVDSDSDSVPVAKKKGIAMPVRAAPPKGSACAVWSIAFVLKCTIGSTVSRFVRCLVTNIL